MKRILGAICCGASLVLPCASLSAAERGQIIRAGDLMAQPFIDAAKAGPVAANQPVTILERKGGWMRVETGGQTGWLRILNVRLAAGTGAAPAPGRSGSPQLATLLRTGSSGKTVTTGVKGLDEEDIRNASPDYARLAELASLAVDEAEARDNAQKSDLKESNVAYLGKERRR